MTLEIEKYRHIVKGLGQDQASLDEQIALVFDVVGIIVAAEFDKQRGPKACGKALTTSAQNARDD